MKNKFIKFVGYFITLVAFIFIGKSLMSMNFDVKYIKNPVFAVMLCIIMSIGYAIMVYVSSYAWKSTLEFINKEKIPFSEITTVYVKSNIGKYLPGNLMHFAGRNILAGKLGFKQLDITFSSLIEIIMLILTDFILSFIIAMRSFQEILEDMFSNIDTSVIIAVSLALLVLIILSGYILVNKTKFISNYKHFFTKKFMKLLCKLFFIYAITLLIPGFFLVIIFKMVLGCKITIQICMMGIAGYTISWVLGFIVPGAPGGIGVRESVLLLMLAQIFTNNIVLLAAILLRITSILGDLMAFLFEPFVIKLWKLREN